MDGFESEFVYPSLTKEEKETLLAKKIEDIRRKNKELERRHAEIEADKKLAVGSRSAVQLPAATVRRAAASDGGDEGETAGATSSTVLGATEDTRRVERMPPQSGDARRELQGTATTAVAHGRSGRMPARRGREPSDKDKNSGGSRGGAAGSSSRDSSLLKFPLKKPGLGFRRFSRESLTAGRRRAWPPKKGTKQAPVLNSSASGVEPAAVGDRTSDGGRLEVRAGVQPSWRTHHKRSGSGDVTTAVAAAAAAAHKGGVADGANGAVVSVAGDGNSPSDRSGSGSGFSKAVGGAADGLATGSRECGTKSGGCSDRARGSAGRSQRKNYEETRKRNSAVYEDEQPLQQQQQQRRRSGTGIAEGAAANCSPPPTQPTRLDLEMRLTGRERRAYSAWKEERDRVDEERLGRARDAGGGWRREWDADKAEPPTPPPPSSASTGSASIAAAAAAPQWPAPASSATSPGAAPARSVLSAAAPAWPYTQPAPMENASLRPQPSQQQRQQRQRQQHESPLSSEAGAGWLAASKGLAQPPPSGCQRRAVGSGRFMSQGDRRKSGPGSGSSDTPCPATGAPRDDIGDLKTRRQPAWPDCERRPPVRRAPPPPPRSPAGTRGGRGGSIGGTKGRRWPSRGGWRMQRSAYGGSTSSLHRPSSRTSVVEDIVIIHVEDDDGEPWSADAAGERGGRPAAKTEGAGAVAAAVAALTANGELSREARASASAAAGLSAGGDTRTASGAVAAMATSAAAPHVRSGRASENRNERYSSGGRRRRGGGGRGRTQVAAATAASRDDARAAAARPRVDGRAGQNKDDEWEDVADAESGTR